MKYYLRTFHPLCSTKAGQEAARIHGLPEYIDGSCRREPDFQNEYPSITGLCTPRFSKRLKKDDIVVYTTIMMSGLKYIVAILEVIETVSSHVDAESWYVKNGLALPNNIMVSATSPSSLDKTNKRIDKSLLGRSDDAIIRAWNHGYIQRAKDFPEVAICKIWKNKKFLEHPLKFTHTNMETVFGGVPVSRNGYRIKSEEWSKLIDYLEQH